MSFEVEDAIEKAMFMLNNTIDAYDLDTGMPKTKDEAFAFAYNKNGIYTSLRIIYDYLERVQDALLNENE